MRDGARAQAAIEVLEDAIAHKRPPALALKDWALKHRFAGSKDRSAIGDIVFMALRKRASSSYLLGDENPRAWVLGALHYGFGVEISKIQNDAEIETHAYSPLSENELDALANSELSNAPDCVKGDYPNWLDDNLNRIFGENRAAELAQMAKPAPLDLRVNIAISNVDEVIEELSTSPKLAQKPDKTKLSPWGIRIPWNNGKNFPFAIEPSFLLGKFEVQDEASQLCALLTGAKEDNIIADVCAGGGGKTLALAAMTNNKARIIAYDTDPNRIAPIHDRLRRVGIAEIDVRTQRRGQDTFSDIVDNCDIVLIDAPCTGSGTWRRAPDTKWRLTPQNIEKRQNDQQSALKLGAPLVKKNGILVYVTCSILPDENDDSVEKFLNQNPQFKPKPIDEHLKQHGLEHILSHVHMTKFGIQFTPLKSDTDGFYFAVIERNI